MHILDFIVIEKVLEEASIVLLVFIILTMNPAQILQRNDIITRKGISIAVQIPQINALINVRYFNSKGR